MHFWILFCGTVFMVSLIPGPSSLIAFAHGARMGWAKAAATAFGNATATMLQAAAACAGLGLILAKSAVLFLLIKYLGAAYLVYMGISMWRAASNMAGINAGTADQNSAFGRLFYSGFLVAASNPKAIIFFTALFPQFLADTGAAYSQMAAMTVVSGAIAFLVAMIYAILGSRLRALNISRRLMTRIYKATGGLFIAGGLGLAAARN